MKPIHFTVDAALLRELGERLVGQPHIALAELVKNSYDADATCVLVRFLDEKIEIHDNGHGMNLDEFRDFWMRIGSPHKQQQKVSRDFARPLTGSKGVGRLAVQFLARELAMHTVAKETNEQEIDALVDWDTAVEQGDLTKAYALYEEAEASRIFPGGSPHGTIIELSRLNQVWSADEIEGLAREIWWLQPPFERKSTAADEDIFRVELESPDQATIEKFDRQMRAYLGIWHARIDGELIQATDGDEQPVVRFTLEFSDGKKVRHELPMPDCLLHKLSFEIRTYYLQGRQKYGIKVGEAREYFNAFGGVRVYDAGFRLPYYGPEHDWLGIEKDHSHRLSRSRLLPESLQVPEGLNYLPTNSRLLGVVHVDTSFERRKAADGDVDHLEIQVTRDRLNDNRAYQELHDVVRWALDFYATQEATRQFAEAEANRSDEPVRVKFLKVGEVLNRYREELPRTVFNELEREVQQAVRASETEAEAIARRVALLGPLATAGMAALAYEHEAAKHFTLLDSLLADLETVGLQNPELEKMLAPVLAQLREWATRARATRGMFVHFLDEENREAKGPFRAHALLTQIREQVHPLVRGIPIEIDDIPPDLRLPPGDFSQWTALFQNVFLNAINAMLDAPQKKISLSSHHQAGRTSILIEDTGVGVDLSKAEKLFEPFVRRLDVSPQRRALGYGGTGLGLTIVRMIAGELGCEVKFVNPNNDFSTAFCVSWRDDE